MKITKVEILATEVPFKKNQENVGEVSLGKWKSCRFVIVKIHTDNGLIGYGESAPWVRTSLLGQKAIIDVLIDYLAPAIIGMNPFDIEAIWKRMDSITPGNPQAKGILDMALYDIMGKSIQLPASSLLGGRVRDKIPLSAIITLDTPENMQECARRCIAQGFRTVRIKLGLGDLKKDAALVRDVRKAIGAGIKLRVDPNQAYSLKQALQLIPVLEDNDVEIYEQPVSWSDKNGLAELNASTWIPVMPHESMSSIYDVKELIEKKAVSLFTIKMDRPGGLTKARITRDMAELYHIPCVVMSSIELSISTFASMQFASTLKELNFACEASGLYDIEDIAPGADRIVDGSFLLPDAPGFGVEIDEEKLKKYTLNTWICDESSVVKD